MKSKAEFRWSTECDEAFELLRELLVKSPVLAIYSPTAETELHCDASVNGFGAVLLQKHVNDGKFHPIAFFSKRTTIQEAKYHSFELEALATVYALERFRIYLQGKKIKIVTDCNSLKQTLERKEINPRILRWSLILRNYDYSLEHLSGEQMKHADALSRKSHILVITENTFEQNLAILQNLDSEIVAIRQKLEQSQDKYYELNNGLVYRKDKNASLFYVPASMERNVIIAAYKEVGHQGINKTTDYLGTVYWFPKMKSKVQEEINTCMKCITYSTVKNRVEGKLHSIDKGKIPFDTLHIDYYGPLERTKQGHKYVFEVIDGFSKFIKLYATSKADFQSAVKH